jgi:thiamine pyrophosphate-dependent acetolactate synthase large subunit-like protein
MKAADAIAQILKREGIDTLFAYPRNRIIEAAAAADIRTLIVRQERVGLHMADAVSRLTHGKRIGAFAMQHGPGTENAYGGIAQAYGESVPILVMPQGYPRRSAHVARNFNATAAMAHVAKHIEPITAGSEVPDVMRRAFTQLRNGRGGPVVVEVPSDIYDEEVAEPLAYTPVFATRYGPPHDEVEAVAHALIGAQRLVIYAGQGVHWAGAYAELRELAELLAAPVCTSLPGKSTFDETHPLALGAGGGAHPKAVHHFLHEADLIFGIGCSFTETSFGVPMPKGKRYIQATLDPGDLNNSLAVEMGLVGDAQLTLRALVDACREILAGQPARDLLWAQAAIEAVRKPWLDEWMPKLTSNETPLNPYRVLWELQRTVDLANTIITHDAGSPRDQLVPFWCSTTPHSFIGWGKTTQLGYGLGLAMGAKLTFPEKLCINVWGDAAIGFTGMDIETAVRERIPILSILLNNSAMAIEIPVMKEATAKYHATDISGNYSDVARALGAYAERVTAPGQIVPAIRRGIEQTRAGHPVLLEFITSRELAMARNYRA